MESVAVSLWLSPIAQAEPDLLAHFLDAHAFRHEQFAGERSAFLSPFAHVVRRATVLAVFIPAKPAIRDRFGSEVLQASQERIVLRDINLPAQKFDAHQAGEGAEERGGSGHLGRIALQY